MSDPYAKLVATDLGRTVTTRLGLPRPVPLRRFDPAAPLCDEPVLVAGPGRLTDAVTRSLSGGHDLDVIDSLEALPTQGRLGALVLDLSAIREPAELDILRELGAPAVKRLARNARVVIIGVDPDLLTDPAAVATHSGLIGATRSIAKELRSGATANIVLGPADLGPAAVVPAVEFLLSGRAAYVDGQPLRVGPGGPRHSQDQAHPLAGKVAVVTGAARGIGAAIVEVLARDGATVVGVDLPAAGDMLARVVNCAGGSSLLLDITDPDAGVRIREHCRSRHGGLDIVIHNAGITRDKLFVHIDAQRWAQVIDVNLRSILAMNEAFLEENGLGEGGRIVCLGSSSGIAGNRGQANYAASKAGVIGLVAATAPGLAGRGITINAVAPGFIETAMTTRMPFATRELGRRINSLQQGGLPVDVAETVAFLAQPAAQAITGQTLRVCGQSLMGA